jgi:hypothetical protein
MIPSKATLERRHSILVDAVHDTIEQLLSPFAHEREIDETTREAVERLRDGLRRAASYNAKERA